MGTIYWFLDTMSWIGVGILVVLGVWSLREKPSEPAAPSK